MTPFKYELEEALADQIKRIMDRSKPKISQTRLAKEIGISRETLNNYLNGKREMPLPILLAIADHLRVSLSELSHMAQNQVQDYK